MDQFKRRGRSLASRCFLCETEEETVACLLVHCQQARLLWESILEIFGVSWLFPFLSVKPFFPGKEPEGAKNARKCGKWLLSASFGQFGMRGILLLLRMRLFLCTG